LRGHGLSTRLGVGTVTRKLDAREQKLAPGDFTAMVIQDMEAIKRFLVQENNAGKLNIEKLCLVGSEMGASVALNWAAYDWSWPVYPGLKQGQFAKGLVLMSPPWAFPGLGIGEAMKSPALHQQISVMVLVGKENEKAMRDATRVHSLLQKSRAARNARIQEDAEQLKEQKDLFFKGFDTELQGGRLLAVRMNPPVHEFIGTFIQLRLVDKDYPWLEVSRKKETSEK
jgi:pimeloyl-ACP methyl ester carboxylesterase